MAGRECYHCKQWVEEGEAHDCWTTTETALTQDLSEDLRDAWERLRDTAYAAAFEVAAADLEIRLEEMRVLQLIRRRLDLDTLTAAAIAQGAKARHRTLT